jgi:K+-transporting ATPase ATPase F chain
VPEPAPCEGATGSAGHRAGCNLTGDAPCILKHLAGRSRRLRAPPAVVRYLHQGLCEMTFDYLLGAALSLALTVYLVYALLRPERF